MTIVEKLTTDLIEYENNPRHNDQAVDAVANSIKEFGFKVPIVIDKNNVIVAGHTRIKAAKKLGIETVPCIIADDLSEEQIKAFRLADNKVGELAEWNEDLLNDELKDFQIDMQQFGFIEEFEEEIDAIIVRPEVEFTESLQEEHNYIVLYFENDIDWIQAQSFFDIKPVKNLAKAKNGKITNGSQQIGVGRVLNGVKALNKILGVNNNED